MHDHISLNSSPAVRISRNNKSMELAYRNWTQRADWSKTVTGLLNIKNAFWVMKFIRLATISYLPIQLSR